MLPICRSVKDLFWCPKFIQIDLTSKLLLGFEGLIPAFNSKWGKKKNSLK